MKVYQPFIAVDELVQDDWLYGVATDSSGALAFSASSLSLAQITQKTFGPISNANLLIAIGSVTDYKWLNPDAEVSNGPLVFTGNSMSSLATLSTGK
jgi:hypothetical protein